MDSTGIFKIRDGFKYEAFYDYDDSIADIEHDTEEQKREFIAKFNRGDLSSYQVIRSKQCECCESWVFDEGLYGIIAEGAEEAIEYFIEEGY